MLLPPLLLALLLVPLLLLLSLRLLHLLRTTQLPPRPRPRHAIRVLIVLGSGGHTTEMFRLLRALDPQTYAHRTYVVSSGDAFSAGRAVAFERALEERGVVAAGVGSEKEIEEKGEREKEKEKEKGNTGPKHYDIVVIPRARAVHQSLLSTPVSAARCFGAAMRPLLGWSTATATSTSASTSTSPSLATSPPSLIITNGPGTAVVVVLGALLLRFFNIRGVESAGRCRTLYVESFARVTSLSLSGRLLVRVVDRFLVQWEGLEGVGGRAEWKGVLV
jgi:beta-1,4-N-acetylglucosaminyltransferase